MPRIPNFGYPKLSQKQWSIRNSKEKLDDAGVKTFQESPQKKLNDCHMMYKSNKQYQMRQALLKQTSQQLFRGLQGTSKSITSKLKL